MTGVGSRPWLSLGERPRKKPNRKRLLSGWLPLLTQLLSDKGVCRTLWTLWTLQLLTFKYCFVFNLFQCIITNAVHALKTLVINILSPTFCRSYFLNLSSASTQFDARPAVSSATSRCLWLSVATVARVTWTVKNLTWGWRRSSRKYGSSGFAGGSKSLILFWCCNACSHHVMILIM